MSRITKLTEKINEVSARIAKSEQYLKAVRESLENGYICLDEAMWAEYIYSTDIITYRKELLYWQKKLIKAVCAANA